MEGLQCWTSLEGINLYWNDITNTFPLGNLTNLNEILLYGNKIDNLFGLLGNSGLGKGDYINIKDNNYIQFCSHLIGEIMRLKNKGVEIDSDCGE